MLTTIVSQDPMYVDVPGQPARIPARARRPDRATDVKSIKVQHAIRRRIVYDQTGEINFVDVTVDRSTDTVMVRAAMPNPNGGLIDGQLVRVVLESGTPEEKVVDSAVRADRRPGGRLRLRGRGRQGGHQAHQARRRAAAPTSSSTAGLSGGEQVIVEGLQAVRPGVAVRASPVPPAVRQD